MSAPSADYNHAAFVAEAQHILIAAYHERGAQFLEAEYGQPVPLEVSDRWISPVRADKRDYRAREYTGDKGRPRFYLVIHHHKGGENLRFDDYAVFDELYKEWLERRRSLTADERAAWERRRAERQAAAVQAAQDRADRETQARRDAVAEEERRDARIAAEQGRWHELPEHGRSAYLVRKSLPHVPGARYEGQTLVVALYSATGEFAGVQRLKGKVKLFTDGARKGGASFVVGGAPELEGKLDLFNLPRFIAEGVATAANIYRATGEPVIVAFDAHNLGRVIREICAALDAAGMQKQRRAWLRDLTVCADNDQWKAGKLHNGLAFGNVGLEAAHKAAYEADPFGVRVACPDFTGLSTKGQPTDFDDLARLAGLDAVKAQLEAATLADPNLVFARRKREYLKAHTERGGTFDAVVNLDNLQDGLTVVQSPQNTQKTRSLIPVAEQCRAEGELFVYVTHRVSLAAAAARKLGLELYSDHQHLDLSKINGLAITVNSLHRLEEALAGLSVPYTVVIDESEQAVPAFTGAHMTDKTANLRVLSQLIGQAQRVVCLDADAGTLTRWLLTQYRPGERVNWLRNHFEVGQGKTVTLYSHRAQVYKQLSAGTYAGTDSLAESRRLAFTLEGQGVKTQLINGETSHDPGNLTFISDIDRHAPSVGAIVASPSLSTGVSLTAPAYSKTVGIFYGQNGPATEALQSLWRARRATEWHVWVQPSGSGEQLDLEARYGVALDAELEHVGRPNWNTHRHDHGYSDLKRLVSEKNQRARRTFDDDFIFKLVLQGITVGFAERPSEAKTPALRELLRDAKECEHAAYAAERLSAGALSQGEAHDLRERGTLTSGERFGLERFDHTEFFNNGEVVNPTWLRADYRSRYRFQLERLEFTLKDEAAAAAYAVQLLDRVEMRADAPLRMKRREFSQQVLRAVGFERATQTLYDALTPDELEAAAQLELERRAYGRDREQEPPTILLRLRDVALKDFARYSLSGETVRELLGWIEENRAVLAGVVALPTTAELHANPVRYIRSWLKPLGLRQARVGKNARGEYVLDASALALAARVFERRGGDTFLKTHHLTKSVPVDFEAISPPPIPPLPPPITADDLPTLLEQGRLDAFGPQKVAVIRRNVEAGRTDWLRQLATSRALGQVLGAL